ncbi:TraR/DksA C4-type zinc finger protein, partial [Patescibacteria group bacterium]|nr:TraR/DksA C4-type zinc finger protein [Patescibacteria group bacterium]
KEEKASIETELKKFADKDEKPSGDWDTRFPKFDATNLEEAANEVEEYSTLLGLEYNLEDRLKEINSALEKIGKGEYGKCEKCGKDIAQERLKVYPAAKLCLGCQGK